MASRILLADDSITIQKVVNRAFAEEGIEVVAVSSGDQAERQLAEVSPDLVLADIFMPGKNGYELCESIKQNPRFRHIPVVLLVGAFEPFDQAEARRVHADDHLTKPFEFRTLIETVRKLISTSSKPQTGPLPAVPVEEEPVRPLEPRPSAPLVSPSFKIDLAAMSEPVPAEAATSQVDAPLSSFDESTPLDLDYAAQTPGGSFQAVDVEMAQGPAMQQTAIFGSPSWGVSTDQLATPAEPPRGFADQAMAEPLDLGDVGFAIDEAPAPPALSSDSETQAVSIESPEEGAALPARGTWVPSRFSPDDDSVVLDFEKTDMPAPRSDESAYAFNEEAEALFEVVASEPAEQAASQVSSEESDSFKTQRLDEPASTVSNLTASDTNPLEAQAAEDSAAQPVSDFGFSEPSAGDVSHESLLSVDDPLGDVLSDESAASSRAAQSAYPDAEAAHSASSDSFELEFLPEQSRASRQSPAPYAEQSQPAEELQSPSPLEFSETPVTPVETASHEAQVFPPVEQTESSAQEDQPGEYDVSGSPFDVMNAAGTKAYQSETESVEWEEAGSGFGSFTHADSTAPAQERAEYSTAPLAEEAGPLQSSESQNPFTASAMWSAEETRFAPIDIEAMPVDEPAPPPPVAQSREEKGFDFTPVAADVVESAPEPVAERQAVQEALAAEPVSQTVELSPAVLDEIVRRVVVEMSDKVVRDIAWEIVPDCVERVIEKLAREYMAKRM